MKRLARLAIPLAGVLLAWHAPAARAAAPLPLHLIRSIPLGDVSGRLDHLALDRTGRRLFVAAVGDDAVVVVSLSGRAVQRVLGGLAGPQGVAFLPDAGELAVANGRDGTLRIFEEQSLSPLYAIHLGGDADDVRVDERTGILFVGFGEGGIAVVDPKSGMHLGDLELPGHPEGFALQGAGSRILVNVPSAKAVVVLDRIQGRQVAAWPLGPARANYPMALDATHHRLFVGLREPPRLAVLDAKTGREIALLQAPADADDLFYDAALQRVYLVGGAGAVAVYSQVDADHYRLLALVATRPGARTGLFDPALDRLFVAAPRHNGQAAQLLVFAPQP